MTQPQQARGTTPPTWTDKYCIRPDCPGRDEIACTPHRGEQCERRDEPGARPAPPDQQRDQAGQFAKGNAGGKGNPFAKQANELRAALFKAVTADDIAKITRRLLQKALQGNITYAREIYDRLLGKPSQTIDPEPTDAQIELKWE